MKRLVTAILLLALIVSVSCVSLYLLKRDLGEIQDFAGELQADTAPEELEAKSKEFLRLWNEKEKLLVIFLRHDILDELTVRIAELPSLARNREYGLFYSGVDSIQARLEDLLDSVVPSYRNLL